MSERNAWTAREVMHPADKAVIAATAENDLVASRIFVTGEVHEGYIGDRASRVLVNANDCYYTNGVSLEPLFTETKRGTIRMERFDPKFVWGCFHPDKLVALVGEEAARIHVDVDPMEMDDYDFYQEMVRAILKGGPVVPVTWKNSTFDDCYNAVYLFCLLLLGKPGYLGVHVAEFFSAPEVAEWMASVDYRDLTAAEYGNLEILKGEYAHIGALTNEEMRFVTGLFDRRK